MLNYMAIQKFRFAGAMHLQCEIVNSPPLSQIRSAPATGARGEPLGNACNGRMLSLTTSRRKRSEKISHACEGGGIGRRASFRC